MASKLKSKDQKCRPSVGPLLDDLRNKDILCDAIIQVESKQFPVHCCVLAATSSYFERMFTEDVSAEGKDEEKIIRLTTETIECAFEQLLKFAYTGQAQVNEGNLKDTLMSKSLWLPCSE